MKYKIIDDPRIVIFYKKCTTRRYKKITGIKFPWFGKDRGKMLVPEGSWGRLATSYLRYGGHLLPKGYRIDAQVLEE